MYGFSHGCLCLYSRIIESYLPVRQVSYCHKCGTQVSEGANYCPHCGTTIETIAYLKAMPRGYSGIGAILVLIGGIIALLSGLAQLAASSFWISNGFRHSMMETIWFFGRFWGGLLFIGSIFTLAGGIAAILLWSSMRTGRAETYGVLAIAIGVILILTMNFFSSIIIVLGGILHYTSGR